MAHELNEQCVLLNDEDWQNAAAIPRELFDFYLLNCPYAKSDEFSASSRSAINLSLNGWEGAKLHQLMQWISSNFVTEDGLQLVYLVSKNINTTIKKFGLDSENPCISHSRCVLHIDNNVSVSEKGDVSIKLKETYITCLFRHIRNAFAHANFAINEHGHILILDTSSKPGTARKDRKYTFGMVTTVDFLRRLKEVVENSYPDPLVSEEMKRKLNRKSYRINLNKEVILEE